MFGFGRKKTEEPSAQTSGIDGPQPSPSWSLDNIQHEDYRAKIVTIPDIIGDWLTEHGGLAGKEVLEFGCGGGTMALSMALRKNARRVVGVDVLDVYRQCLPVAAREIGLTQLPENLEFHQITPGEDINKFGQFDVIYTWSVVEHIAQDVIVRALASVKAALRPNGIFFLQISPLYFSAQGSHLSPWVSEPWAHLSMQHDMYHERLLSAEATSSEVREKWSVYVPHDADTATERQSLWETYITLNKLTAPQLCRLVTEAGFEIVRDYRTKDEVEVPLNLVEVYDKDVLTTQQIVLLLRNIP